MVPPHTKYVQCLSSCHGWLITASPSTDIFKFSENIFHVRLFFLHSDSGHNITTSHIYQCILLTFWEPSEVTDLGSPILTNQWWLNCHFLRFLDILRLNMWQICNIEPFIRPLYHFQCQSGPLTQFALRQFFWWEWGSPLWCHVTNIYSIKIPKQHTILFSFEWGTHWWKFWFITVSSF